MITYHFITNGFGADGGASSVYVGAPREGNVLLFCCPLLLMMLNEFIISNICVTLATKNKEKKFNKKFYFIF